MPEMDMDAWRKQREKEREEEAEIKSKENQAMVKFIVRLVSLGVLILVVLVAGCMVGCPKYNVWEQGLQGQAELARATQNRQIKIQESLAQRESAENLAQAAIQKAKGEAEANRILGDSLAGERGQAYLRYLYIHALSEGQHDVIYVPTEAGLPILEAGRFNLQNRGKMDKEEGKK